MRRVVVVLVLVGAVVLALRSLGPSADEFRETDNNDYEACEAFESAQGVGGETYHDRIERAADLGVPASTPGFGTR